MSLAAGKMKLLESTENAFRDLQVILIILMAWDDLLRACYGRGFSCTCTEEKLYRDNLPDRTMYSDVTEDSSIGVSGP